MTVDWEAFRQALPERAPAALRSWAERTLLDELGGEFLLFRRESTRWACDAWDEFLARVPDKPTWGARCTCTACGEDFTAGYLSPTREGVAGIRMVLGGGQVYTGVPEDEINSIQIAETDHIDCPLCGEDVQVVGKRSLGSGRTYQIMLVTVENIRGVTTLLYWMAHRRVYSEGYATLDIWPQEAVALTERGALKRFSRARYGQFGHTGESKEWRASNSRRDPETILYYSWEVSSHRKLGGWVYPEVPDLTGTTGEKTGLEDYLRAGGHCWSARGRRGDENLHCGSDYRGSGVPGEVPARRGGRESRGTRRGEPGGAAGGAGAGGLHADLHGDARQL